MIWLILYYIKFLFHLIFQKRSRGQILIARKTDPLTSTQVLQARAHKTQWEKKRDGELEPLNKAADILLTVPDKTAEVVAMLGECLQKAGRPDEVRLQLFHYQFVLPW